MAPLFDPERFFELARFPLGRAEISMTHAGGVIKNPRPTFGLFVPSRIDGQLYSMRSRVSETGEQRDERVAPDSFFMASG